MTDETVFRMQDNEESDLKTQDPDIAQLIHQHKKIAAIKLLRQRRGLGLKEAKEAVDEYARTYPGRLDPEPEGHLGGCALIVLAISIIAAAVILLR